jgi:hypothetical protein
MYKDPVIWAMAASRAYGFKHALHITSSCRVQFFVDSGATRKNNSHVFWQNAHNWLLKRAPAKVLESIKQEQIAAAHADQAVAHG